jgi:hypothetical protein
MDEQQLHTSTALRPYQAEWLDRGTSLLAVYRYDDARGTQDPRSSIMQFLESAYRAGATIAGWDIDRLASPDGVSATRLIEQT